MKQKSLFVMGGVSLLAATAIIVTQTNCKTGGDGDAPASSDTGKITTPPAPGTAATALVAGENWPMWSRNGSGNLFSSEKGIASNFDPGKFVRGTEEIDMATTKNVRWAAKLGSQTYGNTTVSGGKVFVGTNNETPRDKRHIGDRGNVYCLDEKTGELLWQLVVPKLGAGKVSDWEYLGICSSPSVEGNRVYIVSNRCEILCLDTEGMKNGNQGFQGEGKFMVDKGKPPLEPTALDADIIWVFDMRKEAGSFPHNIASSSVLIMGDLLFCTTSNGQDWSHLNIPNPNSPCLIALNKKDGTLAGEEAEGIGHRIKHCNWSSPSKGKVNGKDAVFFGAGDGVLYAFDTTFKKDADGYDVFKLLWKYDCVPDVHKKDAEGNDIKYPAADGPSEIIATPTYHDGHVYIALGQDPEHGEGVGNLTCINADSGAKVWDYRKIQRTISTCAIDPATGLLVAADYTGYVYCLDSKTGKEHWVYDTKAHMWSSPLIADGKIFIGDEDGDLTILPLKADFHPKNDEPIFETNMLVPIYSSPIVANGTLYVGTQTHLYAVALPAKSASK
ncbi:MAG: PQQ-binding-like beta-propeller repeat protein [Verrucomicrobiota bacterium]|nr:PQQ-binding-like beta-propeller repeat protein [Verrucomicrobiota bacterium]